MTNITKRQLRAALRAADGPELTDADLARWFGISQSAISQWDEDSAIPKLRALEVALKRPELVGQGTDLVAHPGLPAKEAEPPVRRSPAAPAGGDAAGNDEAPEPAREVA